MNIYPGQANKEFLASTRLPAAAAVNEQFFVTPWTTPAGGQTGEVELLMRRDDRRDCRIEAAHLRLRQIADAQPSSQVPSQDDNFDGVSLRSRYEIQVTDFEFPSLYPLNLRTCYDEFHLFHSIFYASPKTHEVDGESIAYPFTRLACHTAVEPILRALTWPIIRAAHSSGDFKLSQQIMLPDLQSVELIAPTAGGGMTFSGDHFSAGYLARPLRYTGRVWVYVYSGSSIDFEGRESPDDVWDAYSLAIVPWEGAGTLSANPIIRLNHPLAYVQTRSMTPIIEEPNISQMFNSLYARVEVRPLCASCGGVVNPIPLLDKPGLAVMYGALPPKPRALPVATDNPYAVRFTSSRDDSNRAIVLPPEDFQTGGIGLTAAPTPRFAPWGELRLLIGVCAKNAGTLCPATENRVSAGPVPGDYV